MNLERIDNIVQTFGLKEFRRQQLRQAFFQEHLAGFEEISTLGKDLRRKLAEAGPVMTVTSRHVAASESGRAYKALLEVSGGLLIESVLLNPKPGHWSCCISSQVGCPLNCSFCATGAMGFERNLTSEEITDQVLFWQQFIRRRQLPARLGNVVFMGMGEPFLNQDAVFASLTELSHPDGFNIGARKLAVSTVGLVKGIRALATHFPQASLAISLHAGNNRLRQSLVPHGKTHSLGQVRAAVNDYLSRCGRKVFFEYALLGGVNDSVQDANELVTYLKSLDRPNLAHVNLIAYNAVPGSPYQAPMPDAVRAFKKCLAHAGVHVTVRKSLGRDIQGACGQLAAAKDNDVPDSQEEAP